MRQMSFSLPFLPPSLNVYRNNHWRKQRGEEKAWKDHIALKWSELGRPKLKAVRIGMVFTFPDRRVRDLDNYLATGSKLVGDAVKGLFIPDDSPEHLSAWSFRFEFGKEAKTTVVIEEADSLTEGRVAGKDAAAAPSCGPRASCRLYEGCVAPLCPGTKSASTASGTPTRRSAAPVSTAIFSGSGPSARSPASPPPAISPSRC